MKYTTEEALVEIMKRRDQIIIRRDRRACRMLTGTAGALVAVLVLVIALLPGKVTVASCGSVYGSFLLSQEAGGYVLAAVIAFVLGVCVTLLSLRYRRRKTNHKERGRNVTRMNKKSGILIACLILLLAVAIGVIIWQATGKEDKKQEPQTTIQTPRSENGGLVVPERPEMIDITAYESLELKADTLEQSVRFDNPLQNNCWLVITLSLEDGTVLWKSEELQPGQVVRSITMDRTLEAGEYENAVISYQHWTYDEEKLPLNGAETLVTLKVQ